MATTNTRSNAAETDAVVDAAAAPTSFSAFARSIASLSPATVAARAAAAPRLTLSQTVALIRGVTAAADATVNNNSNSNNNNINNNNSKNEQSSGNKQEQDGSGKNSGSWSRDFATGARFALLGAAGYGLFLTPDTMSSADEALLPELRGARSLFSLLGLSLVTHHGKHYLLFNGNAYRLGTTHIITAINTVVFLCWRVPALQERMAEHFMTSFSHVMAGRLHTLVTSAFSHQSGLHFLFNTIALLSIGRIYDETWSFNKFMGVWLGAGVVASLAQVFGGAGLAFALSRRGNAEAAYSFLAPMLGASGALGALISNTCLTYPNTQFSLFFAITLSARTLLPVLAAFDLGGVAGTAAGLFVSPLGHMAHLGGYLSGLAVYQYEAMARKRRNYPW